MAVELKSITKEKYLDTDIDSLLLRFDNGDEDTEVSEFEIPEQYQYMVMISERKNLDYPVWIEVINPSQVSEDSPLPNVGTVIYRGQKRSLRETLKMLC